MARGSLTQTEPDPSDLDEFVEFDEASTQPTEIQAETETETLQSTETQVETEILTTSAETTSAETTSAETESSEISQPSEGEASKKKDDIP
jgi:hypothetical protein